MKSLLIKGRGKVMYLSGSESLKAVLFMRFLKESHSQYLAAVTLTSKYYKGGGFINMHKDISGVLTVSTCLLNRDRSCVSDFTETPPPDGATCVLLYLTSPLPASDSAADNPHLEKKRTCFQRCQTVMVKAQG